MTRKLCLAAALTLVSAACGSGAKEPMLPNGPSHSAAPAGPGLFGGGTRTQDAPPEVTDSVSRGPGMFGGGS